MPSWAAIAAKAPDPPKSLTKPAAAENGAAETAGGDVAAPSAAHDEPAAATAVADPTSPAKGPKADVAHAPIARQTSYLAQKRQLNSQRAWRAARDEMLSQAAGAAESRESRVISFGDLRTAAQGRSVEQARERARLEQCVRVGRHADGTEYLQRYPVIKLEGAAELSHGSVCGEAEFELPVAVILYLRLLLYASVVLLLMFLISLPQTLENRRHFLVRLDCRAALRSHFAALTAPSQGSLALAKPAVVGRAMLAR